MHAIADGQAYSIRFSQETRLLLVNVKGFWTPEVASQFKAEILNTVTALYNGKTAFSTLMDQREFQIQSRETTQILNEIFAETRHKRSGRLALVTATKLGKIQIERNLADPRVRVFFGIETAKAWLTEASDPQATYFCDGRP